MTPYARLTPGLLFRVHYLYLQMIHVDYRTPSGDLYQEYQYERRSFDNPNLAVNFYLSLPSWQQAVMGTDQDVPTVDWL